MQRHKKVRSRIQQVKELKPKARKNHDRQSPEYQPLEPRQLLNATPLIGDDLNLTTPINTSLIRNTVATGLLANDFDPEGSTLIASKVSNPSNGSVTLYADGTFNYLPNTGFVGVDSFLYTVADSSSSSRIGKVQITVGTGLSGAQNLNERISDNVLHAGGLTQSQPLSDGMRPIFRSDLQGTAIVPIVPNSIANSIGSGLIDSRNRLKSPDPFDLSPLICPL